MFSCEDSNRQEKRHLQGCYSTLWRKRKQVYFPPPLPTSSKVFLCDSKQIYRTAKGLLFFYALDLSLLFIANVFAIFYFLLPYMNFRVNYFMFLYLSIVFELIFLYFSVCSSSLIFIIIIFY